MVTGYSNVKRRVKFNIDPGSRSRARTRSIHNKGNWHLHVCFSMKEYGFLLDGNWSEGRIGLYIESEIENGIKSGYTAGNVIRKLNTFYVDADGAADENYFDIKSNKISVVRTKDSKFPCNTGHPDSNTVPRAA
ncbi:hypothetical protein EVAR_52966_1 [Eumeta japonica]|uniref:Uncharacterized protein n=1 Tax=Eumeta variegata TaxID=151549 RepID=A0A4C1YUZ4_EUMVA|nr:hypothetical protein EVAR_52966_1 [Eumeta japonica]